MKYSWIFFLYLATNIFCTSAFSAECNEAKGVTLMEQGNLRGAFRLLEDCSNKPGVSGDTLLALATLYESPKATSMKKEDALMQAWSLKHKAAVYGNLDALIAITRAYAKGDKHLKIDPNLERHECLVEVAHSAAGHKMFSGEDVIGCLTTTPN